MARWYDVASGVAAIAAIATLVISRKNEADLNKLDRENGGNVRTFGLHDHTHQEGEPLPAPFPNRYRAG